MGKENTINIIVINIKDLIIMENTQEKEFFIQTMVKIMKEISKMGRNMELG